MAQGRLLFPLQTNAKGMARIVGHFTTTTAGAVDACYAPGGAFTVTKPGTTGLYKINLGKSTSDVDTYSQLIAALFTIQIDATTGYKIEVDVEDVDSATAPYIQIEVTDSAGAAANLPTLAKVHMLLVLNQSSAISATS